MTDLETMVFDDLTPIELPVQIGGKDYVLREASHAVAAKFNAARMRGATLEDGVIRGIGAAAESEALLVSWCLFHKSDGKPVPLSVVQGWPNRTVKPLFEKIKEISDLDESETVENLERDIARMQRKAQRLHEREGDPAKNAPDSTTPNSNSAVSSE